MPSSWFEPLPARATYQAEAHAENRAALAEAAAAACARTAPTLLAMQKPDGYWVGDLLADSTLESDYILLQLWLHPPRDGEWKPPSCGSHPAGAQGHPGPAEVGRRLQHLPGRPRRSQRDGQGLHRAQARGSRRRQRAAPAGARRDPRPGRPPGGQQLRQDQPQPLRPLPEAPRARRSRSSWPWFPASSSTRCRRGRARSSCRCSIVQADRSDTRPVPAGFTLDELVAPGQSLSSCRSATGSPRCSCQLDSRSRCGRRAGRSMSGRRAIARRRSGCSTTRATPTGSAPSIRR